MKYTITIFALLALVSCEKKQDTYRCECSSIRGQIVYQYESKYNKAEHGVGPCELVQDSIALAYPSSGIECSLYNIQ